MTVRLVGTIEYVDTATMDRTAQPALRLVTPAQLKVLTQLSAEVFRQAWQRGELDRYGPPSGARVMYDLDEVYAWMRRPSRLSNRTNQPTKYNRLSGLPGSNRRW